jgi:glycosyltransferase involved in cell wall biosynthesis
LDWPLDAMARVPSTWALRSVARTSRPLFVGVSRADAAALEARFPRTRVRAIVNVPPARPSQATTISRSTWGPVQHALLFVGRLVAQKGLDRLLGALASPALARASLRLLVVGDGPDRFALESLAARLGIAERVTFLGETPAGPAMDVADFVLCPSRYEGMPLVPMEGILAGSCVVASPIAPHRELFAGADESLLPADEAEWAAWLANLLSEPERRDRLVARQALLRPRFSPERIFSEYRAAYEMALEDARRSTAVHAS